MSRKNHLGQRIGEPLDDWVPPPYPPRTPIEGKDCRIESLDPDQHGDELFESFSHKADEGDWTYLPYGPFDDNADFQRWLEGIAGEIDPLFYTVVDRASGRALGLAAYLRISPDIGSIEIGHIHFGRELQRTRASTEAQYLMMGRVFDELGYRRYEWKCDALNEPSRRAALRLGFTFEGIFRQATHYKGRNRDTAWYSIIDGEWQGRKQAFLRWLDESNFDEDGRQRQSLSKFRLPAQK